MLLKGLGGRVADEGRAGNPAPMSLSRVSSRPTGGGGLGDETTGSPAESPVSAMVQGGAGNRGARSRPATSAGGVEADDDCAKVEETARPTSFPLRGCLDGQNESVVATFVAILDSHNLSR